MMDLANVTDQQLVASLRDNVCPACGKRKALLQTLCRADYYRLSPTQRHSLYDRLGAGYREAVAAAISTIGLGWFVLPDGSAVPAEKPRTVSPGLPALGDEDDDRPPDEVPRKYAKR
jgi:hypothetical protein